MESSINAFTSSLFFTLLKDVKSGSNVFLSPLSISTALSMLLLGCGPATKEQLLTGLHLKKLGKTDDKELHSEISQFLKNVTTTGESSNATDQILLSNLVFLHKQMLSDSLADHPFVKQVKNFYQSDVEGVDFTSEGQQVMKKANDWVASSTKGMIQEILDSPPDSQTRAILLNAIYFKGKWKAPFDQKASFDAPFFNMTGNPTQTRFMAAHDRTELYAESVIGEKNDIPVHILDLPYSSDCSMRLVVPKDREGDAGDQLKNSIQSKSLVTESQLKDLLSVKTSKKSDLNIILPVFKFEREYTMNGHLKALGITDILDPQKADFTGISPLATPGSGALYVSEVKHKAVVDVNEEGTEAAAVTGIMMRCLSFIPPTNIRGDRPFLFFIRKGETVLFAGLYASVPEK